MHIQLIDLNPQLVAHWASFPWASLSDDITVEIKCGDITKSTARVWVTPTNVHGNMSGGVDAAIKHDLSFRGYNIEECLKQKIQAHYPSTREIPIGKVLWVLTTFDSPQFIVAAPTMEGDTDDISRTMNVAQTCLAVFKSVLSCGQDATFAIPGLGTGTGQFPPSLCARIMFETYKGFLNGSILYHFGDAKEDAEAIVAAATGAAYGVASAKVEATPPVASESVIEAPVELETPKKTSYLDSFMIGTVVE